MKEALEKVVATEVEKLGYDLVELRVGGSRSRPTLDVRIDRRDGEAVTVDDCAIVSRGVEARLDTGHEAGERYRLEVSSPGVERLLRNAADWRRFAGSRVNLLSPVLHGREEVEIVGVDESDGGAFAVVRDARGDEQRIALADVKEARLAFHW